ncbi:MAG: phenylacetate--CoA ligase [Kiritimatiellae bacterium]|jgi:phenylacetate-CoA ligase|nr:phenylacetate--CoA ligase [Kiritimatiellia bacterium]
MNTKPLIENAFWQKEEECMPRAELRALQLQKLRSLVARVYASVPAYTEALDRAGVKPDDIKTLDDIRRLPFTTKADLRNHYPLGYLAIPRREVARFHGSSGSTGKPTFVAYSKSDMNHWADLCARFLYSGGLRASMTAQVSFGYGLFTGGFGLHQGIERVGAAVLPASSGNTARQLVLLQDMRPDYLICTPSYALHLADGIQSGAIDRSTLNLKGMFLGSEPWTENMRRRMEEGLGVYVENNYGLSEIQGPGVSGECAYRNGMHIAEDHFIVECVNPGTLEPVAEGEEGELVFTTLNKEAFPLLRYRTRDISTLHAEPCPCGRTSVRMSRVTGRTDDMLIIRGVNVYPSQIETALLSVPEASPHYMIEVARPSTMDEVTVHVELKPGSMADSISELNAIRDRVVAKIAGITGLHMRVFLEQPNTLERFEGKSKRVKDLRNLRD